MDEKFLFQKPSQAKTDGWRYRHALLITVIALQVLLWTSLFVLASTAYLFVGNARVTSLQVPEILMIAASASSILYVLSHAATYCLKKHPLSGWSLRITPMLRLFSSFMICLVVAAWLASCGVIITVTVTRQSFCLARTETNNGEMWMSGQSCVLQQSGLAAGLLSLISSIVLSITLVVSHDPFTAGLFGYIKSTRYPSSSNVGGKYRPMGRKQSTEGIQRCSWSSLPSKSLPQHLEMKLSQNELMGLGISKPPSSRQAIEDSLYTTRPTPASICFAAAVNTVPHDATVESPPVPLHVEPKLPSIQLQDILGEADKGRPRRSQLPNYTRSGLATSQLGTEEMLVPPQLTLTAANLWACQDRMNINTATSSVYSRSVSDDEKNLAGEQTLYVVDGSRTEPRRSPLSAVISVDQVGAGWYPQRPDKAQVGEDMALKHLSLNSQGRLQVLQQQSRAGTRVEPLVIRKSPSGNA
ncbi:hypothetical protein BDV97DRAFT_424091 [Delphinella strobiligena]|nr:hypothetical protein BDV97DRAFT_424091 [Delphinella strobiligena]